MRKILFGAALASSMMCAAQDKEKRETIEGNGKIVSRDVAVNSFEELKASGVYELQLVQGNKEAVRIETDENLQDLFTVRNEGTKLVVEMKKDKNINMKKETKTKVYVTFRQLKALDLNMVGNVKAENELSFDNLQLHNKSVGDVTLKLNAKQVNITNKSVGEVNLSGKAEQATVKNAGVGELNAGNFVVNTMYIENTGVGEAEVNCTKDLKLKDSFLGKVKNKGNASVKKMNRVRV
jgi:hypothetical protein